MHRQSRAQGRTSKIAKPNKETKTEKKVREKVSTHASFLRGDVLSALKKVPSKSCRLLISSPPYNIGKEYERSTKLSFEEYLSWQDKVIEASIDKVTDDGSICWQVGNYVDGGESFPLDIFVYQSFKKRGLKLRNRIVWKFNFGLHSTRKLSGRYETLLWFTKSDEYQFNLNAIRVSQIYPGKRHPQERTHRAGLPSGNPLGKNPGDIWEFSADEHFLQTLVWDIPNVKANHPEKTFHPCQFPVELAERCVLAFTEPGDTVLDPFVGTGTSVIAAIKHERHGIGIDKDSAYLTLSKKRVRAFRKGSLKIRPIGKPIHRPKPTDKVAIRPTEWAIS